MNAEAQRLGMTHTQFVNPTGLPDPEHKSSARDLAILARAIIRDSAEYYPIYAEHDFKYNGIKQGNRNALLYTDPTVDGLKTGHTAGRGLRTRLGFSFGLQRALESHIASHASRNRSNQAR